MKSDFFRTNRLTWLSVVMPVAAITLPWFLAPGYVFLTDFVWGPRTPFVWSQNGLPAYLFLKILGVILSAAIAEKIFLATILMLVAWAGQRLARVLTDERSLQILTGLFFLFNPFIYDRLGYGQVLVILGFGFFVLGAAELLANFLRPKPGHGQVYLAALWFGLAIQSSPHFLFFTAAVGLVWLSWVVVDSSKRNIALLRALAAAALVIFLVNANWIIGPLLTSGELGPSIPTVSNTMLESFRVSGKSAGEAYLNVLMMSGFWGKDQHRYVDLTAVPENWGRSFLILLPLILWGAIDGWRDRRRRSLAMSLLAVFAVAVFLAVGVSAPGSREVATWLTDHLPFYSGMRESQKWVAVIVLVYGIFLTWGAAKLLRVKVFMANRTTTIGFVAAVIVMQASFMLWGMNGVVKATPYPDDWQTADRLISENGCRGRTVFLPWHMYMSFSWIGNIVATPARNFFHCPLSQGSAMEWGGVYQTSNSRYGSLIEDWIGKAGMTQLFKEIDARYVIVAKEVDWAKYEWLDDLPGLRLVQDTATLKIYEVTQE